MSKQNSAFPIVEAKYNGIHQGFENVCTEPGMSKRFYAACMAMQGLLSNPNTAGQIIAVAGDAEAEVVNAIICRTAFKLADELLKQENNE